MTMSDLDTLRNLVLARYILKATALIKVSRKVGVNQFRHSFSTLGILLDYKYYHDSILLKASRSSSCYMEVMSTPQRRSTNSSLIRRFWSSSSTLGKTICFR